MNRSRRLGRAAPSAWYAIALAVVALLAFALRALPVDYSLPYVDHPDEPNLVNYAIAALRTGDMNPHFFQKPSLYMYLLLPLFWLHYRWGLASGLYAQLDQMNITTHLYTTIPGFFIWGRMLTVIIGALTVIAVYVLAARVSSRGAGLLAALFVATLPFHMDHSQFVTTDVPSALWVLLSFMAAWTVVEHARWRAYLLAGLCAGLAASTKYNAGAIALAIIAAHALHWGRDLLRRLPRLLAAGGAALFGFVLGTPYALLAWPEFWRGVTGQLRDYSEGLHGDALGAWNIGAYAEFFWTTGLRPLAGIAALLGLLLLLRRRRAAGLLWLSFGLPYLLLLMSQQSHFWRNLMPLIVLCSLPVGVGAAALWQACRRRLPRRLVAPAAALLAIILLGLALAPAVGRAAELARPDSRVTAQMMIRARYPGVRAASEIQRSMHWNGLSQSTRFRTLAAHPPEWYREQGFGLLITSSDVRRSYAWTDPYKPLVDGGRLVATYGRPGDSYRGPQIDVFETALTPDAIPSEGVARFGPLDLLGTTIGRLREEDTGPEVDQGVRFRPGDVIAATSFWRPAVPVPAANYTIFLHLRDQQGQNLTQRDAPPALGLFPPQTWQPEIMVVDRLDLPLPPTLPPGAYRLVLGLYDSATQKRFPVSAGSSPLPGDELDLGLVEVVP